MVKVLFILCVVGMLAACSSHEAIYLSPKAFQEACGNAIGEVETGDASNAPPKLIAVGMLVSVSVGEDASLNKTYPVTPSCTLDLAAVGRMKNQNGLGARLFYACHSDRRNCRCAAGRRWWK